MNLPLAPFAPEDKDDDPDDRVIVTLMHDGRLLLKGKTTTLEELASWLEDQKELYRRKMLRMEKPAFVEGPDGTRWTRLFALVRADRLARWEHVRWVLAELAHARYDKVQFAVRRTKGRVWTKEELDRLRTDGADWLPADREGKLPFRFPRDERAQAVVVRVGQGAYEFDAGSTESLDELAARIGRAVGKRPKEEIAGRIVAGGGVRHGKVVGVADVLYRLGIETTDFGGAARAPAEARRQTPLPGK